MKVLALTAAILLSGCATVPGTRYAAHLGQGTDSLSTVIALNSGFVEANPIVANNLWLLAIKPLLPFAIRFIPPSECVPAHRVLAHLGFAPGLHNLALVAGAGTGASIAVGVMSISILWSWIHRSAEEACL
jgi:hypothetical protein